MPEGFGFTQWITTQEAAELTGYSSGYLRAAARKGLIRAEKHGRDWFLDTGDVLAYVERMKELGTSKHNSWIPGGREKDDAVEE
ncbi:MAG: helix-turn-helix domain-containing protein [Anaerolineae bacterium]|nr:helix-turn-helix domain-containing protein [Anaerolineae bacterium]